MTQLSFFYDGTTVGDADQAPYNDTEWSTYFFTYLSGKEGFVIPDYLNSLNVVPSTNVGKVIVQSGAACFYGLYTNDDEVELDIDACAANPRLDAIVLEYDSAAQTIRADIVKGAEAASPDLPVLTSNQMLLAHTYVTVAYNPAADLISDTQIYDQRHFMHLGTTALLYASRDYMPNGEFMFYSSSAGANPPDNWREVGTLTSGSNVNGRIGEAQRGSSARIRGDINEGIATTVLVPTIDATTRIFTVKCVIEVEYAGKPIDMDISYSALGGAIVGGSTTTKRLYPTANPYEFILRKEIPDGYSGLDISITAVSNTSSFTLGQIMVLDGWVAGPFRLKHEWIFGDILCEDSSWNVDAKSTGTTTINLNADYSTPTARNLRGVIMRLRARDSASLAAGGDVYLWARSTRPTFNARGARVDVEGVANDYWRENVGIIDIDWNNANMPFELAVQATGVGTLDAAAYITGIIT